MPGKTTSNTDGQLSHLRALVGKAIVLQSGVEVVLWQDIATIPYGPNRAATIERTIGQTTFFIPILTPRFLRTDSCLNELRSYRRRMIELGREDLIFPVHYVSVDNVQTEDPIFGDDLAVLRRVQWVDFRPHFYSPNVRQWADDFASSILQALRRVPAKVKTPALGPMTAEAPAASGGPYKTQLRRRFYISYAWADEFDPNLETKVDDLCEQARRAWRGGFPR